jgi:NAD(P)-dependent dehydrogenase (short-subunit alcohol dehydrogenase family)
MLCNSAAIQRFGRTDSFDFLQWQQVININLSGTFLMCKAALPHIVKTKGRVVNIASLAGRIGIPYSAAYSASKGGVIMFTKALAKEYADRDVCISAVTPGAVDTPMLAMKAPGDINPKVLGVIPRTARDAATPEQVASLIVFLLTEAPYSMTGSVVPIDGASG